MPSKKQRFAARKAVVQGILVPMVVFATQQYLTGHVWPAAGALTIAVAAFAYETRVDIKRIPWSADQLEDAAKRIGAGEEDLAKLGGKWANKLRKN